MYLVRRGERGSFLENRRLSGTLWQLFSPDGQATEKANTGPAERHLRGGHGNDHRLRKQRFYVIFRKLENGSDKNGALTVVCGSQIGTRNPRDVPLDVEMLLFLKGWINVLYRPLYLPAGLTARG